MSIAREDWERFMNDCRIELTGASDTGIKNELFNVLDMFCVDSDAWQEQLQVPVIAGNATTPNNVYTLTPQNGGKIIKLIGAFDPNAIPQPSFLPNSVPGMDGGPFAIGPLVLVNPVNLNQIFNVIVAKSVLLPTSKDDMPVFDGNLFQRYRRYIVDGVVGRMCMQPNKPFTNAQVGSMRYQMFRQGVNTARGMTARQNTKGAQGWAYPQGWRVRGQRGGVSTANPTTFD